MRLSSPSPTPHTVQEIVEKQWNLHVVCGGCKRGRSWTPVQLAEDFPAHVTDQAIGERMKCSHCDAGWGWTDFTQNHARQAAANAGRTAPGKP